MKNGTVFAYFVRKRLTLQQRKAETKTVYECQIKKPS